MPQHVCEGQRTVSGVSTCLHLYEETFSLPTVNTSMLWNTLFEDCKYALLLLVNKELTGLELGRERLGQRARLGGHWEE